ncbi:MAG: LicD family protein [Clostridia bacterium]|nr:LicD family protein [Clostridia bacterium]
MRLHDVSKASQNEAAKVLSDENLKKLQNVLLMMLEDLAEICRTNNFKFVLIGGTGIGAMRHSGFIPWDDDVDIAMSRDNYQKLCDIIRNDYSDKYLISDPQDKNNFGKIIPKLRLLGTKYQTVLDSPNENVGIRMDIFIIENTFDNSILRYLHGVACMFFGFALTCKRHFDGRKKYAKLSNSLSFKIKSFLGVLFSFASLETWARWTDNCHKICKNNNSKFITIPSDGPHYFKGLNLRSNICETRDVLFEGKNMWVPFDVDNYLKSIYGDYMQIPPENKRVRGQYLEFDFGVYDV